MNQVVDTDNPRKQARQAIQSVVSPELWKRNGEFSSHLLDVIQAHGISRHPLMAALSEAKFDLALMRAFHLEFQHAFARVFTDALLRLMFTTRELETEFGPLGKVAPRFLLQLNLLDELGFKPGTAKGGFSGSPMLAHYVQFDQLLSQLELSRENIAAYRPSGAALACQASFEENFDDHMLLSCVLAVAETVFGRYSGPWAMNVGASTGVDVSQGYHSIHVEHEGESIEDEHSEDAWCVFRQAARPERYDEIESSVKRWLDTWCEFLEHLLTQGQKHEASRAECT